MTSLDIKALRYLFTIPNKTRDIFKETPAFVSLIMLWNEDVPW